MLGKGLEEIYGLNFSCLSCILNNLYPHGCAKDKLIYMSVALDMAESFAV